jgi:hypothetical protein
MGVELAIRGRPQLTDHEAHALATLLAAMRTPASLALSVRLDPRSGGGTLELSADERCALLAALAELDDEQLPPHLIALEETLAAELGRVAP